MVKNSKEKVIIPFTNITGIYFWGEKDDKQKEFRDEEAKKHSSIKPELIRRPR